MVEEEGRVVVTDHQRFVLVNIYAPAVSVEGRDRFKMEFLHAVEAKVRAMRANGRHVVVAGDFNICPREQDCAARIAGVERAAWERRPSRVWLDGLLGSGGFVDSFRGVHPGVGGAYSCWSEVTKARENNYGIRIDLIVVDGGLFKDVVAAEVHGDVEGSDHCPVSMTVEYAMGDYKVVESPPKFCTTNLRRFAKRQMRLTEMFGRRVKRKGGSMLNGVGSGFIKKEVRLGSASAKRKAEGLKRGKQKGEQARISSHFRTGGLASAQGGGIHKDTEGVERVGQNKNAEGVEQKRRAATAAAWRKLLTGPKEAPLCRHGRRCKLKVVGKAGENKGRTFFSCVLPGGIGKEANCNFFQWAPYKEGMGPLPN